MQLTTIPTETSFFRDTQFFDLLQTTIVPELLRNRHTERRLTFWCAACSTGQEAYSLAILLHKYFPLLQEWKLQIIASDVSAAAIARGREGRYSDMEIQRRLPPELRDRYFTRQGNEWRIDDEIRLMVDFYQIDLLAPWPVLPPIDAILLRNILIYLNDQQKRSILKRMRQLLRPNGYLCLGANETIIRMENRFETVRFPGTIAYKPVVKSAV